MKPLRLISLLVVCYAVIAAPLFAIIRWWLTP